ncbi:MAG: glycoside hydrolase family 2 protein [Eubacterium sp.]|nr:glycoside hydrolase family 2 protein [Eubacterium sp.]
MRRIIKLMEDWQFTYQGQKKRLIDLPHTWNAVDGQDGNNDYFRGTCYYEKRIPKPEFTDGERVYLQFHGVNASAKVIWNKAAILTHENGYATFRKDVTDLLQEQNELLVEADNGKNEKVYPQAADFTFYGGIYREVEFLIVPKIHFDLDYYGGPGIQVSTEVRGTTGFVKVRAYTNIGKEQLQREGMSIVLTLSDAEGETAGTAEGAEAVIKVPNAHLWNGVKDPYLYRLTAQIRQGETVIDEIGLACGIRTFSFDPDRGFFLNGESYPLRGVSRHQDWKGLGNAISYRHMEQDMELIREVGANTIRLAHYQHHQHFYDLCDQYGMVVWAEIPYISAHMPKGRKNTFFQIRELIVQNYNHPCIVTWGISNEITISGKYRADMLDNHHALQKFVKELDPGRPTTLACYAMCHPFHPVSKITDLVAWNLYLGWYVPGLFLNDLFLKFYHWKYPRRCLGYSEYGAEGMPNLHSAKPRRGDHSEEYQAKYHEYMLECFARHPFLWSTYVWNMFDFAADARDQGGEPGMNHKGLVTFDRKIKKDSFYIYKAWWSKEPFVHLCGKRYKYRAENVTNVTVYSNQRQVSLYQNGQLVETKQGQHAFHFKLRMDKENHLEARAGTLSDKAVIYKAAQPRPEYKVKKGKSQNWV